MGDVYPDSYRKSYATPQPGAQKQFVHLLLFPAKTPCAQIGSH